MYLKHMPYHSWYASTNYHIHVPICPRYAPPINLNKYTSTNIYHTPNMCLKAYTKNHKDIHQACSTISPRCNLITHRITYLYICNWPHAYDLDAHTCSFTWILNNLPLTCFFTSILSSRDKDYLSHGPLRDEQYATHVDASRDTSCLIHGDQPIWVFTKNLSSPL
jgi:hypothetical protein